MRHFLLIMLGLGFGLFFGADFAAAQETKVYPRLTWMEDEKADLKPAFTISIASIDRWIGTLEQIMMEGSAKSDEIAEYLATKAEIMDKINELNISTSQPFGGSILVDEELFYLIGHFPIAVKQNPLAKHDGPITLESLADENIPNVFEQIGPEPLKVLREKPDLFTLFGPMFAMRSGDNIVLGTDGIQKRVVKNPKQFMPGPGSENVLAEEIFYFDGEQRKILKTFARIPMQFLKMASGGVEHENPTVEPLITGLLNTVRDAKGLFFEFDRLQRTLAFDVDKSEILIGETYDFTPGGKLDSFCKTQKENKSPLLGFYQPDEAICAGIVAAELIPEQKEIAFRVLDMLRYVIANRDALENKNSNGSPYYLERDEEEEEIDDNVVSFNDGMVNVLDEVLSVSPSVDLSSIPEEGVAIALKVVDHIEKFITTGRYDAAYTLRKDGTMLGAVRCNAGNDLAEQLNNLKEMLKGHELGPIIGGMVRINAEEVEGMKFSYVTLPYKALFDLAQLDEEARAKLRFFDEKNGAIVLGCSGDFLVFAMSCDSTIDSLRKTLDQAIAGIKTPGPIPETVGVFSLYEFAKCANTFLAQIEDKDEGMEKLTECFDGLVKAGPEAKISCEISYRENGLKTQLRAPSKAIAPCVMWLKRNQP